MADIELDDLGDLLAPMRVEPGRSVHLDRDFDPGWKGNLLTKTESPAVLERGIAQLGEFQERLAAQDHWSVLVVLQAIDAAGKDGTIRHVMSGVNPQGVSVHGFKVPSTEELDHDYLWRYAKQLPRRGEIAIFNRSHYEEVLVVRVHPELLQRQHLPEADGPGKEIDGEVWKRRYREINAWERYLSANGTKIVKIFLHLSKEEQRKRFLRRIDLPDHNWKFSAADAHEREYWDDYQHAFSQMLSHTSTEDAPWHVVPADHKWFARVAVCGVIVDALREIDPQFPEVGDEERAAMLEAKKVLEAE